MDFIVALSAQMDNETILLGIFTHIAVEHMVAVGGWRATKIAFHEIAP
jgi:hypothetical protein